jgi:ribosomal protein L3 glutamine methyltransferase
MSTPQTELITIRDWLRWAVSEFNRHHLFFGHGCDNAYDEAVWLILHSLHLPADRLDAFADTRLTSVERMELYAMLQNRIEKRVPAAYLTHEAWLGEFSFYVDERVIVPRSYFAELFRDGMSPWLEDTDHIETALDLCTGSGCLAILMAHTFPNALIDAVDLSTDALDVAQKNISDYGLDEQIRLVHSDAFAELGGCQYDLIISNPPYVTEDAMREIPDEYRQEPEMALVSGEDGLDLVRVILQNAGRHLTDNGLLFVEVGHNAELVEAAWPDLPLTWVDVHSAEGKIFMLDKRTLDAFFPA